MVDVAVAVELQHLGPDGDPTSISDTAPLPVRDLTAADLLGDLVSQLAQTLTVGGTLSLSAATLAALEVITLGAPIALDSPTLAALEQVTATAPLTALRLDYAGRTDKQPVYLGKAAPGSADADPVWTVTRFTYESATADARLVVSDVRTPLAWTSRTTPTPPWS